MKSSCNPATGAKTFNAILISRDEIVRRSLNTVTFELEESVKSVKNYYSGIDMLGKHYLVHHID